MSKKIYYSAEGMNELELMLECHTEAVNLNDLKEDTVLFGLYEVNERQGDEILDRIAWLEIYYSAKFNCLFRIYNPITLREAPKAQYIHMNALNDFGMSEILAREALALSQIKMDVNIITKIYNDLKDMLKDIRLPDDKSLKIPDFNTVTNHNEILAELEKLMSYCNLEISVYEDLFQPVLATYTSEDEGVFTKRFKYTICT